VTCVAPVNKADGHGHERYEVTTVADDLLDQPAGGVIAHRAMSGRDQDRFVP